MLPSAALVPTGGREQASAAGRQPPLAALVPGVRWGTLALGAFVAAARGPLTTSVVVWGGVLVAHAAWRGRHPVPAAVAPAVPLPPLAIIVEVFLTVLAVDSTGYWASPFAFSLLGAVAVAGLAHGFGLGMKVAAVAFLGVALPAHLELGELGIERLGITGQWGIELGLVAALAGCAHRVFGDAEERHSEALDRASRLAEANELLVSLHRVAQTLPASLDLDQASKSTVDRVRSLIDCDIVALLLHDPVTDRWVAAACEGTAPPRPVATEHLPAPLRAATASSVASLVVSLAPGEGLGPTLVSRSGLYAPLRARGTLVGLIAIEHHDPGRYGRRDLQLLDGLIDWAALAVDNARWFGRLRGMGAEEERTRIAREMHDRVGQSLAYVAFELDRMAGQADEELKDQLEGLRAEVRGVLGEVRDTLSDLRAEVSEERGLEETLESHLERVAARSPLIVDLRHHSNGRLPLAQERELWRIAQEAITNAERHSEATHLRVRWTSDGRSGRLTVADDGRGFAVDSPRRPDSFGITGMKERANTIGATLLIESEPYVGTLVDCCLDNSPAPPSGSRPRREREASDPLAAR